MSPSPCSSFRKLGAEYVHVLDLRRRREQVRGLRHERLGNGPVQMGLSPGFIAKRVEDGKRRRTGPQREPQRRRRLLIGELQALHQECGQGVFFARLGFQADKQTEGEHRGLLWADDATPSERRARSAPWLEARTPYLISLLPCVSMSWSSMVSSIWAYLPCSMCSRRRTN